MKRRVCHTAAGYRATVDANACNAANIPVTRNLGVFHIEVGHLSVHDSAKDTLVLIFATDTNAADGLLVAIEVSSERTFGATSTDGGVVVRHIGVIFKVGHQFKILIRITRSHVRHLCLYARSQQIKLVGEVNQVGIIDITCMYQLPVVMDFANRNDGHMLANIEFIPFVEMVVWISECHTINIVGLDATF